MSSTRQELLDAVQDVQTALIANPTEGGLLAVADRVAQAARLARHLGFRGAPLTVTGESVVSYEPHRPWSITVARRDDGGIDGDDVTALSHALAIWIDALRPEPSARDDSGPATDMVTLSQIAGITHLSKRTWERRKKELPRPVVKAAPKSGKADLWSWAEVRPCLEEMFDRSFPEQFPAHRP